MQPYWPSHHLATRPERVSTDSIIKVGNNTLSKGQNRRRDQMSSDFSFDVRLVRK